VDASFGPDPASLFGHERCFDFLGILIADCKGKSANGIFIDIHAEMNRARLQGEVCHDLIMTFQPATADDIRVANGQRCELPGGQFLHQERGNTTQVSLP